jgi:hypothetical protein
MPRSCGKIMAYYSRADRVMWTQGASTPADPVLYGRGFKQKAGS